jgi:hypothetical protein
VRRTQGLYILPILLVGELLSSGLLVSLRVHRLSYERSFCSCVMFVLVPLPVSLFNRLVQLSTYHSSANELVHS